MKKILKLSVLLLGALIVLLGCSQETKSEFVLQKTASNRTDGFKIFFI